MSIALVLLAAHPAGGAASPLCSGHAKKRFAAAVVRGDRQDTDANFFNFGMLTCIVSFVIGLVLMAAGFYAEVAPAEVAAAEENFRRSAPDPESALRPHP